MSGFEFNEFADKRALATVLADYVGDVLTQAILKNGRASLVVSGGRTPMQFFEALSCLELKWNEVTVLLADERWVPETHARSNTAFVRENLIKGSAARAHFLPFYSEGISVEEGATQLSHQLEKISLDMVVLGMGEDGHTASLFPDAPAIAQALAKDAPSVLVARPTSQPEARITLSVQKLKSAAHIALHIEGQLKRDVLEQAALDGAAHEMPIRPFLQNDKNPLQVFWCP
ncbi:MAG: 6-phosphogluconolactonase [Hyphomicrobiales bacterium]